MVIVSADEPDKIATNRIKLRPMRQKIANPAKTHKAIVYRLPDRCIDDLTPAGYPPDTAAVQ